MCGGGLARAPAKPLPSSGTAPSIWPSCRRPSAGSAHGSSVSVRDRDLRHHSFWCAFESWDAVWIRMLPATRCTCECCSICTAWTDASVGGAGCGSDANREAASDPEVLNPRHAVIPAGRWGFIVLTVRGYPVSCTGTCRCKHGSGDYVANTSGATTAAATPCRCANSPARYPVGCRPVGSSRRSRSAVRRDSLSHRVLPTMQDVSAPRYCECRGGLPAWG